MYIRNETNGLTYFTSPLLTAARFPHAFCTRKGGVSCGDFASLNVSTSRKNRDGFADSPEHVEENYRRALALLDLRPEQACAAKQIHSNTVIEAREADGGKGICASRDNMPDADAVLLADNNAAVRAVCVKTADCVPILLANRKTGSVCAVHAGWRGTAAGIVREAAKKLADGHPQNVLAAIGPCIGLCCYEVGDEVVGALTRLLRSIDAEPDTERYLPLFPSCSASTRRHADLAVINRALLASVGVPEENVDCAGLCTACTRDADGEPLFFSHRASGGHSGTFVSLIRSKNESC